MTEHTPNDPHAHGAGCDHGTPADPTGIRARIAALAGNTADSADQTWEGRTFQAHDNAYAEDDGSAPAELAEAQRRFAAGEGSAEAVIDAFRSARLLIPLVAHAGDIGVNAHGQEIDKTQELSIITVEGPDGRNVLPVFSSVAAMQTWNPKARPVPADGIRVALAAAEENTDLVVLDATTPLEFVIRRPALWAIAREEAWIPSFHDPEVFAAFVASIGTELSVLDVALSTGDPLSRLHGPELVVTLTLMQGLDRTMLDAVLQRLAQRWAQDDVIATRADSLTVRLRSSE
ncbi:SseB family protein [Mycetocola tolaasinivorans]|uniref:SseB family protein n=1 Tax=Mycetocola tolaasinivorans TaxID=76635 RepID=A0A3L7AC80_9MICO|nr:SseB family protein [Mycetocola tolaasinivorans]RLP77827.1 SseB family protein [Mycetocola tolaasinivorans]